MIKSIKKHENYQEKLHKKQEIMYYFQGDFTWQKVMI